MVADRFITSFFSQKYEFSLSAPFSGLQRLQGILPTLNRYCKERNFYGEKRERERERERQTDRQTETERDRERQTETERDRQRQTETDRERDRERFSSIFSPYNDIDQLRVQVVRTDLVKPKF